MQIFKTDFSDVKLSADKRKLEYLDGSPIPLVHSFNYTEGMADCKIIDSQEAIGGKAFEMSVLQADNINPHERFELNVRITDLDEITDEFYTDVRIRLPYGYALTGHPMYPTWTGWHEIANALSEWRADNPDNLKHHLGIEGDNVGNYMLSCTLRKQGGIEYFRKRIPWVPIDTRAFHLKTYVKLHPSAGIIQTWIDDTLFFDLHNVPTLDEAYQFTALAKLYGGTILPEKKLWVDSITIHDTTPIPPIDLPTVGGIVLAVADVALISYAIAVFTGVI